MMASYLHVLMEYLHLSRLFTVTYQKFIHRYDAMIVVSRYQKKFFLMTSSL